MSQLRFEEWVMPGADVGPENPLPPLQRGRGPAKKLDPEKYPGFSAEMLRDMAYGHVANYLPYTMQDRYTRQLKERPFKVAVLENDILKATFLLELGGRLRSLVHKPSGRELFEANPVFQPANLAIRNAWFSGGVEWNIGMRGHCPFTCSPLFVGKVEGTDGTPVLRMWEWERIRKTPFQIDAYLPDGSPVLLIRVRIANPHDETVPMYWWSNTAVPETEKTRVLVPADSAYNFGYGKGGPARVDIPQVQDTDISYTTNIGRAVDFFFHLEKEQRPWISSPDEEGRGLVQVSTDLLKGRKLFLWGMGAGGRKWQEFLSEPGHAYIEIQSGLARTQMEHLPMPAGATWEWLEGYGLMETDPQVAHGADWGKARQVVEEKLETMIPRAKMETEFARTAAWADQAPIEIVQCGSGWGALESKRLAAAGNAPFSGAGTPYAADALSSQEKPWLALLEEGALGEADPEEEPLGYMVQPEWRELLEQAVAAGKGAHWSAWLHLGVMRYYAEDFAGAKQAWEESLAACETPWARRNLAVLAREEERTEEAGDLYVAAVRQRSNLFPLAVECGRFLLEAKRAQDWLDLVEQSLVEPVRSAGRIRLLEGQAALAVGDFDRVEKILAENLVIDDLREGERSLSHLWFEFHEKKLSTEEGIPIDDALKERVKKEFPVPEHLDFRMSND
jgi:hypothetical protein